MKNASITVCLIGLGSLATQAATVSLDFTTASQYDDNFVELTGADIIGHDSANQNVRFRSASSNTSTVRYDTSTGNGTFDNATYLTETISADITYSSLGSDMSFGLYTRIQTTSSLGILGLVNTVSGNGSSIRLRLFYGSNSFDASAGTSFFDATYNLTTGTSTGSTGGTSSTNTFTTATPLTISLTQTDSNDPVFSLTVSDADGLIAATGSTSLTATDTYNGPGAIGARFYGSTFGTIITMDNFSAVPEPSAALLGALGVLGLLRRRRN